MAMNFKFPDVGEGIHEGKMVKWLVNEGDEIKEDAVLCEVETDKAVVEIPSPRKGFLLKLYFKEGDVIKVGQTLVAIGEKGEAIPIEEKAVPKSAPAMQPASSMQKPLVASQISFQSASQTMPQSTSQIASQNSSQSASIPQVGAGVIATPSVRQRARELNLDLNSVKGSGPGGRITAEDVENATKMGKIASAGNASLSSSQSSSPQGKPAPLETDFSKFGEIEKQKISGIRKRISEVMSKSKKTAAHVTHFDNVDITALSKIREDYKAEGEKKGIKVTYLPFIIKAIVLALQKHPKFNSSFDEANDEIILKKYFNIGIAIDTPDGLIVPVIHFADKKDIFEISSEITKLAGEAKERKLKIEDLKGGSFTITNVGSIGGEFFTPIINFPEVAILGLGRLGDKVVVLEGKAVISKILPLSLSFDHRIIDGAEAARFANDLIILLENPEKLK
ncbi:2-oxo acid dehydrogenase subunit E2 [Candidatus Micrarchaeota archaeon]|nr:2-oxo acid dehydrogenase subunit E2 [Candidatus Micrarchaeota archaeon]